MDSFLPSSTLRLISLAALAACLLIVAISPFLLSVPGGRAPLYGAMACLAPLIASYPYRLYRLLALILCIGAIVLTIQETKRGQDFKLELEATRTRISPE